MLQVLIASSSLQTRGPFISRCLNSGLLWISVFRGLIDVMIIIVYFRLSDSLGPHQVLVFEGRSLQIDDSLGPQGDMKDPPNLDIHLGGAKDHHIVVLHTQTHGNGC